VRAGRGHATCRCEDAGGRIVELGSGDVVFRTSGATAACNQDAAIGEERGGVMRTRGRQVAGGVKAPVEGS
jgi:hypothetical protein